MHDKDFNFVELLKIGRIELGKAAVTAAVLITPHVKKRTMHSYFINTAQPSNTLQDRMPDQVNGN
ncbi:MAG: hypothetical protein KZQ80_17395 [Candidatus Thiodiazotropha sp. (ex Monitilora ramsayi)]|nr:hypothetical protein [Candidatus Thiodiazotropha sp. (ex Monitilora ramsayi)]